MNRRLIVAFTAGATLTVAAGCRKETAPPEPTMTMNPPMPMPEPVITEVQPEPVIPEISKNPPAPPPPRPDVGPIIPGNPPAPKLPTWESVRSNHPEGATNPPRPILLVDPVGRCYKKWVGGMLPPTPETSDGIRVCAEQEFGCGTEIQCNDKAKQMLADWKAKHP